MAELYFRLVVSKLRTCNRDNRYLKQVPEDLYEDVITLLTIRGYDADGNKVNASHTER